MAQAIMNKDVRKNCVNVEKIIEACLSESEVQEFQVKAEPINVIKLSKKLMNSVSNYNAKYHQELINLNQITQKLDYGSYEVGLMKSFRK
ncbi:MAG: hypothetical protein ACFE9Q_00235 [Candidatus Hodarchaeota archaeon]